jgi:hypothetical protein
MIFGRTSAGRTKARVCAAARAALDREGIYTISYVKKKASLGDLSRGTDQCIIEYIAKKIVEVVRDDVPRINASRLRSLDPEMT